MKLYCSYLINKIARLELNVWPLFISVLLKFRNEMLWLSYCDVRVIS
jgi:hypothetical protein